MDYFYSFNKKLVFIWLVDVMMIMLIIIYLLFSTAFMAYSTWNTRPSGENVEADKSYWIKETQNTRFLYTEDYN